MGDLDEKDAWREGFNAPLEAEMPYRNGTACGEQWKWGHSDRWGWVDALTPAQAAGLAAGTHVVVPVEITDAMVDAWWDQEGDGGQHGDAAADWAAMLAAAQKEG
tara:strand:+ start:4415 stop:4729 length:315 start_codon:yes stop_codon:yes gene_type:complete